VASALELGHQDEIESWNLAGNLLDRADSRLGDLIGMREAKKVVAAFRDAETIRREIRGLESEGHIPSRETGYDPCGSGPIG
jgi:hypothetical protein